MMKIYVYNMQHFIETVDSCEGPVKMVTSDGIFEDLRGNEFLQNILSSFHAGHTSAMPLNLNVQVTKDYMRLVYFMMGDC